MSIIKFQKFLCNNISVLHYDISVDAYRDFDTYIFQCYIIANNILIYLNIFLEIQEEILKVNIVY